MTFELSDGVSYEVSTTRGSGWVVEIGARPSATADGTDLIS